MISISEALTIVTQNTFKLSPETIALGECGNRILAENVFADMDLPPFDRSQMDGFAVRFEDLQTVPVKLKIVGEAAAGDGWRGELKTGEAIRIMTGAPLPGGADAVQKVEVTRENGDFVEILESVKENQNIVRRGAEITKGDQVFHIGERITSAMTASLAAFGCAQIRVFKRPKVAILATGSEIVAVDETPQIDQIRNSNSTVLKSYAEQTGAITEILPTVKDEIQNLKSKIQNANADVLILSGGVSVGKYDFTKTALRELGAEIFFEKVALRPGKPTVFAKLGDKLIFGLPGNPVSVVVTFLLFARTALLEMQSAQETELKSGFGVLSGKAKGAKERDSFLPARISINKKAQVEIELLKWNGSSDFVSFARADALVFVPQSQTIEAGNVAQFLFI